MAAVVLLGVVFKSVLEKLLNLYFFTSSQGFTYFFQRF